MQNPNGKKPKRDIKNIILLIFLLAVFGVLGMYAFKNLTLSFTGIKREAVVTDVEYFSGTRGLNLSYVFKDLNGVEYNVRKVYTNRNHPSFHEGEKITIAYDEGDTNNIVIVSDNLYITVLFVGISLSIIILLIYGFLRRRNSNPKRRTV